MGEKSNEDHIFRQPNLCKKKVACCLRGAIFFAFTMVAVGMWNVNHRLSNITHLSMRALPKSHITPLIPLNIE
jgi:hypothetical protein